MATFAASLLLIQHVATVFATSQPTTAPTPSISAQPATLQDDENPFLGSFLGVEIVIIVIGVLILLLCCITTGCIWMYCHLRAINKSIEKNLETENELAQPVTIEMDTKQTSYSPKHRTVRAKTTNDIGPKPVRPAIKINPKSSHIAVLSKEYWNDNSQGTPSQSKNNIIYSQSSQSPWAQTLTAPSSLAHYGHVLVESASNQHFHTLSSPSPQSQPISYPHDSPAHLTLSPQKALPSNALKTAPSTSAHASPKVYSRPLQRQYTMPVNRMRNALNENQNKQKHVQHPLPLRPHHSYNNDPHMTQSYSLRSLPIRQAIPIKVQNVEPVNPLVSVPSVKAILSETNATTLAKTVFENNVDDDEEETYSDYSSSESDESESYDSCSASSDEDEDDEPNPSIQIVDSNIKKIIRVQSPIGADIDVTGNDEDVKLETIDNCLEFQQIDCASTDKGTPRSSNTARIYDTDDEEHSTQLISNNSKTLPAFPMFKHMPTSIKL